MSRSRLEPFFIESSAGRIFATLRAPSGAKHCAVFVPPFGEEMNKCRSQVTKTAQALVTAGYAVLVVDLFGTGDSAGDFEAATWHGWKQDIVATLAWAESNGLSLNALVAIRLGCALGAECLREAGLSVDRTVFWQPVESGRQFMTQFLRLRMAAAVMRSDQKETVESLQERLDRGEIVHVAGYALTPEMWRAVEVVELSSVIGPHLGKLAIFEIGGVSDNELSRIGRRLIEAADDHGIEARGERIRGEPFWSATEIVVNPQLTQMTADHLMLETQS